jgi:hypothetical protein
MNINNIPGHGNGISAFFTSSINIKIRKSKNKDKKANEAYDHHCTTKVN